jgi:hypothetical protein
MPVGWESLGEIVRDVVVGIHTEYDDVLKLYAVSDVVKRFFNRLRTFGFDGSVSNTTCNVIVNINRRGILWVPDCVSNNSIEVHELGNLEKCSVFGI